MAQRATLASATDLAAAIRDRKTTSTELVEAYRAQIDKHNPALNAIVLTDWDRALATAAKRDTALQNGETTGPLHGVPITIKEAFDYTGTPATWGLPTLKDNFPARSAIAVERLEAAGAVIMGKTNVARLLADHQSFNPVYGRTNNPWDLGVTPGGSSGGAAAALAAGLTGLELGSDIGGSIRHPSHCCGVFGHKPTFGICPTRGHDMPGDLAPLDMGVVGPMGRSAADLDLGLSVLAGPDAVDAAGWRLELPQPTKTKISDWKIGVMLSDDAAPVDDEIQAAIQALADFLGSRGAQITSNARPLADGKDAFSLYTRLLRSATTAHLPDAEIDASVIAVRELDPAATGYVADTTHGRALMHRSWHHLNERRFRAKQAWAQYFENHDILLCPVACSPAAPHDETSLRHERMITVNNRLVPGVNDLFWAGMVGMAYLPSTVAPIGLSSGGLPIGVQIVGKWYDDRSTIAFARLLEQEFRAFVPPPNFA